MIIPVFTQQKIPWLSITITENEPNFPPKQYWMVVSHITFITKILFLHKTIDTGFITFLKLEIHEPNKLS
jgi:hypothetical protein